MYVLLEGIDNSGKSTQLKMLKDTLGDKLVALKEPGNTEIGKEIREMVLNKNIVSREASALLFLADRAENYEINVSKNRKNKIVVSDRGFISGISYTKDYYNDGYFGSKYDFNFLFELNKFAMKDTLPNKIVMFQFNKEVLELRIKDKELDNIEVKGVDYLMKVQEDMINIIKKTDIDFIIVDANESKDVIHRQILDYIK